MTNSDNQMTRHDAPVNVELRVMLQVLLGGGEPLDGDAPMAAIGRSDGVPVEPRTGKRRLT